MEKSAFDIPPNKIKKENSVNQNLKKPEAKVNEQPKYRMVTKIMLKRNILKELLQDQDGYLASLISLPSTFGSNLP
jgi:hypothetical protein